MKNQFFYTRKEPIQDTDPVEYTEYKDSINLNKVIRSVEMSNDSVVVLLDDMHERITEVPNINTKTNKVIGTKKKVEVYQTEAYLYGEDIKRFRKLTNIE
jgi:hypothetical protein|uniref:Uncharacterized protein n=1 Tax=Virus NIOZ-UU157 TaxID=2763269 RepID=A0A7S9SU80_9VIRU|nr:MAG: hypothetical protein NIOZUU157_00335 [Virus NIOZ-UU157]